MAMEGKTFPIPLPCSITWSEGQLSLYCFMDCFGAQLFELLTFDDKCFV